MGRGEHWSIYLDSPNQLSVIAPQTFITGTRGIRCECINLWNGLIIFGIVLRLLREAWNIFTQSWAVDVQSQEIISLFCRLRRVPRGVPSHRQGHDRVHCGVPREHREEKGGAGHRAGISEGEGRVLGGLEPAFVWPAFRPSLSQASNIVKTLENWLVFFHPNRRNNRKRSLCAAFEQCLRHIRAQIRSANILDFDPERGIWNFHSMLSPSFSSGSRAAWSSKISKQFLFYAPGPNQKTKSAFCIAFEHGLKRIRTTITSAALIDLTSIVNTTYHLIVDLLSLIFDPWSLIFDYSPSLQDLMPHEAPKKPETFESVLEDFERLIMPGVSFKLFSQLLTQESIKSTKSCQCGKRSSKYVRQILRDLLCPG